MSKLSCFKVEPVSDHHMEKCGRWYEKYRKEMIQAMGNKDESANEVIQRYKQVSSSMNLMDHVCFVLFCLPPTGVSHLML